MLNIVVSRHEGSGFKIEVFVNTGILQYIPPWELSPGTRNLLSLIQYQPPPHDPPKDIIDECQKDDQ